MGNLADHAKRELQLAGLFDEDSDYRGKLGEAVLAMVELFENQQHSGFSAGISVELVEKLCRYQPLTPLTGEDDEWTDVAEPSGFTLWQNKRCSTVFKDDKDGAYDIEGRIFREPNGACFTNRKSWVPVVFPYTPCRVYVDVPSSDE